MNIKDTLITIDCKDCHWYNELDLPFDCLNYFWKETEEVFNKCPNCHSERIEIIYEISNTKEDL